ncbi:MAG: acyl--CoA ligase [Desulfobacterales bacterium]|nr:acyl--CoA ligase [Desulfobacterales bacterium]
MILATQENIQFYTEAGVYSTLTLVDRLAQQAKTDPERVCLVDPANRQALTGHDPERITYGEFVKRVDATAAALVKMGLKKDDVVMVQLPNCWELAMLYFAVSKAGGITSPSPVLWRENELSYIAGLTEARFFVTLEKFNGFSHFEMGESLAGKHDTLEHLIALDQIRDMAMGDPSEVDVAVDANDVFTICWTSGTEANPKGCPMTHNTWAGIAALQDAAGVQAGDTMLTAGPLVNMASVGTIMMPWVFLGGTLILHHPFDPAVFMQQIMTERPNYTLLVPALANMVAKHPQVDTFDLSSFRNITLGSAPPSLWTMQEFKRRWDIDIGNIWGQNEGTGFISGMQDLPDMEMRASVFPHYGKPGREWKTACSKHVVVKLVDAMGNEVTEVGQVGELCYKGPGLIAQYFKNPQATQSAFTDDGFFRTGDIFRVEENDCISFYERAKDIIIRGGFNISSQEIENHIMAHPKVTDAAVVGFPDEKLGERMCVYVTTVQENGLDLAEIVAFLEEKGVAKYKHPERLEVVEAIPRNPVGKILKKDLRRDIKSKMQA